MFANTLGLSLTDEDIQNISRAAARICHLRYCGITEQQQRKLARLSAGLLPNRIFQTFSQIVTNSTKSKDDKADRNAAEEKRVSIYSAHDNTIMALLAHLGFRDWPIPEFASSVVFELWQENDTKDFIVRFAYNPHTGSLDPSNGPQQYVLIPGGGSAVKWSQATPGSMSWNYFLATVMEDRESFKNPREWRSCSRIQDNYEEDLVSTAGLSFGTRHSRSHHRLRSFSDVFCPARKATFTTANSNQRTRSTRSSMIHPEDNATE